MTLACLANCSPAYFTLAMVISFSLPIVPSSCTMLKEMSKEAACTDITDNSTAWMLVQCDAHTHKHTTSIWHILGQTLVLHYDRWFCPGLSFWDLPLMLWEARPDFVEIGDEMMSEWCKPRGWNFFKIPNAQKKCEAKSSTLAMTLCYCPPNLSELCICLNLSPVESSQHQCCQNSFSGLPQAACRYQGAKKPCRRDTGTKPSNCVQSLFGHVTECHKK